MPRSGAPSPNMQPPQSHMDDIRTQELYVSDNRMQEPYVGENRPPERYMYDYGDFQSQYGQVAPLRTPVRIPAEPANQYSISRYSNTAMDVAPPAMVAYQPSISQEAYTDESFQTLDRPLPPLPLSSERSRSHWSESRDSITTTSSVPRFRSIKSWANDQRSRTEGSEVQPIPLDPHLGPMI